MDDTPRGGNLGGGASPPLPLYILEVLGCQRHGFNLLLGAALPLSLLVSCGRRERGKEGESNRDYSSKVLASKELHYICMHWYQMEKGVSYVD